MLLLVVYCERVLQSIDASAFHSSSGILKLALIFRSPYSWTLLSKEIQFSTGKRKEFNVQLKINVIYFNEMTLVLCWKFPDTLTRCGGLIFFFNQKKNYCRHLHNCWTEFLCVTFCKRSLVPSYSGSGGGLNSVVKSATSAIIFSLFFFMLCGLSPGSPRPVTR